MTPPAPTKPHSDSHAHEHPAPASAHRPVQAKQARSVLAWPAWLRVLAVLPVVLALWLAVWWANAGVVTW